MSTGPSFSEVSDANIWEVYRQRGERITQLNRMLDEAMLENQHVKCPKCRHTGFKHD